MKDKDSIATSIAATLNDCCPAFSREPSATGVLWHHCHCSARMDENCSCVWRINSTCLAGQWPQLAFVDDWQERENIERANNRNAAREAIERANHGTHRS